MIHGLLGWYFLPTFLANSLQQIWYTYQYPQSKPERFSQRPVAGSQDQVRLHRRLLLFVALAYLCYDTLNVFQSTTGSNYYTTMDLKVDEFSVKDLKSNFRKLSLKYHPDKVGQSGAEIFVGIREAHEVLVDPILRQAYDRFGIDGTKCPPCKTSRDFFNHGRNSYYQAYVGFLAALVALNWYGGGIPGRYWLYMVLGGLAALELAMIQRQDSFKVLSWIIPNRVTFERIQILRNIYSSLGVAVYRMGDKIMPRTVAPKTKGPQEIKEMISKLEEKTTEAADAFNEDLWELFDAYRDNDECMTHIKRRMVKLYEEKKLFENPTFKEQQTLIHKRARKGVKNNKHIKEY
ncbi:hypothetical protein BGZ83_004698 [Gryganskiella cystojenkinii]|nr:hypothetical protein BGZ83_004698 [Gryganskiella cystojenkinii]